MEAIERKLNKAGYRMLGEEPIEELILSILESENTRYLKAIPYLLHTFQIDIPRILDKTEKRKLFFAILNLTSKIFREFNIDKSYESDTDYEKFDLDYDEFRNEFELQIRKPDLLVDKQKFNEERELQFHLSQIFTEKEKQTLKRMLENKPVSKTEYEYYSRKTKKKIKAIVFLEDFAKTLLDRSPRYDAELFRLKSLLEDTFSEKIESFHTIDSELFIRFEEQMRSIHIADLEKDVKDLLKKYPEHDFR